MPTSYAWTHDFLLIRLGLTTSLTSGLRGCGGWLDHFLAAFLPSLCSLVICFFQPTTPYFVRAEIVWGSQGDSQHDLQLLFPWALHMKLPSLAFL